MLLELFLSSVDLVPGDTILLPTTGTPTYLCKVGDPQISSANNLLVKRGRIIEFFRIYTQYRKLDERTFGNCDPLQICDLRTQSFFAICGLQTSANPQIHVFFLTNIA